MTASADPERVAHSSVVKLFLTHMCAWYFRTSLGLKESKPRSTDSPGSRQAVSRPSLTSAAAPLPLPVFRFMEMSPPSRTKPVAPGGSYSPATCRLAAEIVAASTSPSISAIDFSAAATKGMMRTQTT